MSNSALLAAITLSTFHVTFYDEENGQVMIDRVRALDHDTAMGVASNLRGQYNEETEEYDGASHDLVLISSTDEKGKIECPGTRGAYLCDILEQDLFYSNVSENMLTHFISMANILIGQDRLTTGDVESGSNKINVQMLHEFLKLDSKDESLFDGEDKEPVCFNIDLEDFQRLFELAYPDMSYPDY